MIATDRVAVVGVDLGTTGDHAILDAVRMLIQGAIAKLHVLHVVTDSATFDNGDGHSLELAVEALRFAPEALEARVQRLARDAGLYVAAEQVQGHGRLGEPVTALLQLCVDYDADLLIVGAHGRRGSDRMVAASVAEQLLRKSHCPVLVARPKDYEGLHKSAPPALPHAEAHACVANGTSMPTQKRAVWLV
ncbi:MAG: Universal stress protein UspA [Myxococcaceae bacterium]|nr:Universal stress protein UspA [Myxococcaceae bacterium]